MQVEATKKEITGRRGVAEVKLGEVHCGEAIGSHIATLTWSADSEEPGDTHVRESG